MDVPKGRLLKVACVISLIVAVYLDFLATSMIGLWISYAYTIVLGLISFWNLKKGFEILFISFLIIPAFDRDIISTYTVDDISLYYTPLSVTFSGFALLLYNLFFILIISFLRSSNFRVKKVLFLPILFPLFLVFILIFGLVFGISIGEYVEIRHILSDFKFPIVLFGSIIVAYVYRNYFKSSEDFNNRLTNLLILVCYIYGIRTIVFIIIDLILGIPKLGWNTDVVLIAPVLFSLILIKNYKISYWELLLFILAMIPNGRGPIISFIICFFVYAIIKIFVQKKLSPLYNSIIALFILSLSFHLILPKINEPLYNFINFKLSFFQNIGSGEISASPKVRVYEFYNIHSENEDNGFLGILLGKGPGGFFTYKNHPIDLVLNESDYSPMELSIGKYLRPHTFLNYFYLKSGILGLLCYCFIFLVVVIISFKKRSLTKDFLMFPYCFLYAPLGLLNSNWRVELMFLTGIILLSIFYNYEEKKHMVCMDGSPKYT
ncbi:hypothetical protein [Marinifilum sp.]|uniref:hypothetical protein n=1 Tax=Marinifilum sp. TaxID=2033137 RepID=UPI003BAC13DD